MAARVIITAETTANSPTVNGREDVVELVGACIIFIFEIFCFHHEYFLGELVFIFGYLSLI